MVKLTQVQKGFTRFVDSHVSVAYSGIEKVIVSGAAGLIAAKIPDILKAYTQKPLVASLGLLDTQNGYVDIDAIYNAFVPQMGAEKLPISLPSVGKIELGTIKLGKEELDTLLQYIKEA